jgi:hypothetical protein
MEDQEQEENKMDVISVDVPLFIRLLEFAREDATDDMMLHDVAEKLIEMCADGDIMQMEQYEEIIGTKIDSADTSGMNAIEDDMQKQNKNMNEINEQRWLKLAGINEDESTIPTITKIERVSPISGKPFKKPELAVAFARSMGTAYKVTLSNGKTEYVRGSDLEGMYGGDAGPEADVNPFVGYKWED